MTSEYHAIVDAGGNIYPGTFSVDAVGAQGHLFHQENPEITLVEPSYLAEWWKSRQGGGDRCVRCTVETHETCKVTIQMPPEERPRF